MQRPITFGGESRVADVEAAVGIAALSVALETPRPAGPAKAQVCTQQAVALQIRPKAVCGSVVQRSLRAGVRGHQEGGHVEAWAIGRRERRGATVSRREAGGRRHGNRNRFSRSPSGTGGQRVTIASTRLGNRLKR